MVGTYPDNHIYHTIYTRCVTDENICIGFDIALILVATMLSKDREKKERYRHIDEKRGVAAI